MTGKDKLKAYMDANGLSPRTFGEKAGVDHTVIWRVSKGERPPNMRTAKRIETATGGKVRMQDWIE